MGGVCDIYTATTIHLKQGVNTDSPLWISLVVKINWVGESRGYRRLYARVNSYDIDPPSQILDGSASFTVSIGQFSTGAPPGPKSAKYRPVDLGKLDFANHDYSWRTAYLNSTFDDYDGDIGPAAVGRLPLIDVRNFSS